MRTLIDNATLYTGNAFITDGCIQIEDQLIAYCGKKSDAPAFSPENTIDAQGCIAMSGLSNAHTHISMTLLRGLGSNLALQDWLEQAIFPAEDKLTAQTARAGAMLGIMEQLRFGVTCFADMYYFMDGIAEAVKQTGIRALLTRGIVGDGSDTTRLDENIALIKDYNGACNGRILCGIGTHGEYTNSEDSLLMQAQAARELNCPIHVHVSETFKETQECKERHNGLSPTQYLAQVGLLGKKTVAAHCVWVDDNDINTLSNLGVSVVHNPISNLKLASGFMPLDTMLKANINVALGTDGCASNNNLNIWEEIRFASIIHKGYQNDPTLISPQNVLDMATYNGAKAMGFDKVGKLLPGWHADIILVNAACAHMHPVIDPYANLVYSAQGLDVRMTMVDGQILYKDGQFMTLDEQEVIRKADEAAKTLL